MISSIFANKICVYQLFHVHLVMDSFQRVSTIDYKGISLDSSSSVKDSRSLVLRLTSLSRFSSVMNGNSWKENPSTRDRGISLRHHVMVRSP